MAIIHLTKKNPSLVKNPLDSSSDAIFFGDDGKFYRKDNLGVISLVIPLLMIDVDILVYKEFKPDLFEFEGEVLMCDDGIKDMFNSGVVVFDKSVINDETYNGVLAMVEESPRLPDQVIINDYFKDKIRRLPHRYNVTGPILAHIKRDRIAVYHYAGSNKPWNSDVKNNFFQDWINYAKSLNLI